MKKSISKSAVKKLVICAVIGIIGVAGVFVAKEKQNDIVRIHIRASSDGEEDQKVKIKVRDGVNEYLSPKIKKAKTKQEAEKIISDSLEDIRLIGESISGQAVTAELKRENFPQKTYGDKTYPAGEYTALIISIGGGEGRNWWCVAFPPMCYTTSESGKTEYRSLIYEFLERIGLV